MCGKLDRTTSDFGALRPIEPIWDFSQSFQWAGWTKGPATRCGGKYAGESGDPCERRPQGKACTICPTYPPPSIRSYTPPIPVHAARSRRTVGMGRPDGRGSPMALWQEDDLDPDSSPDQASQLASVSATDSMPRRSSPQSLRDNMGQALLQFYIRRTTGTEAKLAPCRTTAAQAALALARSFAAFILDQHG